MRLVDRARHVQMYGTSLQDTSVRLTEHAGVWGTENHHGFGVLNYLYEGLVTGDRSSVAVAIIMIILVIGGSFGVVIQIGAINTGMYASSTRSANVKF